MDARTLTDKEQSLNVSPTRTRIREPDEACALAVDLARAAAQELAGAGQVGPHRGTESDGDRVVTHLFDCMDPAYRGWRWAITVARASRAKVVTVSEGVLLPGPESLLAPDWVPWRDRVRPGDVGVGDLLPAGQDDERLVPAVALEGDDGVLDWDDSADWAAGQDLLAAMNLPDAGGAAPGDTTPGDAEPGDTAPGDAEPGDTAPGDAEPGIVAPGIAEPGGAATAIADGQDAGPTPARARVLSAIGRDATAERWYASEHGPRTPLAHAAPAPCATCGFLVRLGSPLGRVFGVCANEYAPDDGRVVSLDHGCGAHSEAVTPAGPFGSIAPLVDELGYDLVDAPGISMTETVFESLDHG
jgi:Protein of unknown function (DUF3027)